MIGTTLLHYRVLSKLGAGAMGEVYCAEDTSLGRKVAVKLLPETLQHDPERLARLQREAKLLAALNHPNIAAIYGLEEARGKSFLVLELVEGKTLAECLSRDGPFSIADTLAIGRQIAEGLEAAHERGIMHRDLKPANVKITAQGKVKILDFGLAKTINPASPDGESTILSHAATHPAAVLGTPAYMSPEQARGQAVDRRTDVWAFGCLLFECLTAERAFSGDSIAEVLVRVLQVEPDWTRLPTTLPANLTRLLQRCLRKDPAKRLRDLGDARLELEEPSSEVAAQPQPPRWSWRSKLAAVGTVLVAVILAALWPGSHPPPATQNTLVTLDVTLPEQVKLNTTWRSLAISPDGKYIAAATRTPEGKGVIYIRSLAQRAMTPVPGTDEAHSVFFSPDSQWIGFATTTRLWRVAVSGGQPIPICKVSGVGHACWLENGQIIFDSHEHLALASVPATGGVPQVISRREGGREWRHGSPEVLPGGKWLLYDTYDGGGGPPSIVAQSLLDGERRRLFEGVYYPRYAWSGHLLFESGSTMMAVPIDPDNLQLLGPAVAVEGIQMGVCSRQGTLIYLPGERTLDRLLVWVDRAGNETPLISAPKRYFGPRISPDGHRLAFWRGDVESQVWILDLRTKALEQFTTSGRNFWSFWSPDGSALAYSAIRSEQSAAAVNLYLRPVDGTSGEVQLTEGSFIDNPTAWTRDGKSIVVQRSFHPQTGWDIMLLNLAPSPSFEPLLASPAHESRGELSPDNRWLAYVSTEAGAPAVFVRPFRGPNRKWRISPDGVIAGDPLWSPDGRELFYRDMTAEKLMVVWIEPGEEFQAGSPRVMLAVDHPGWAEPYGRNYDIAPDGQRFVMVKSLNPPVARITVVLNWFEELSRLSPKPKR